MYVTLNSAAIFTKFCLLIDKRIYCFYYLNKICRSRFYFTNSFIPIITNMIILTKSFYPNLAKPVISSKPDLSNNSNTNPSTSTGTVVKTFADSKVRDKVNALVNATTANAIKDDIRKQREEDLQVLANRFNKQKDFLNQQQQPAVAQKRMPTPPPPPPPMATNMANITAKRRSRKLLFHLV